MLQGIPAHLYYGKNDENLANLTQEIFFLQELKRITATATATPRQRRLRHQNVSMQVSLLTRSSISKTDRATRRDATCQSNSCQLLHNNVGTTCTTSPEQIEVMELEGYSRPTYNKLVHSATTSLPS